MLHIRFVLAASLNDELLQDIIVTGNNADFEFMIAPVMTVPPGTSNLKRNMRLRLKTERERKRTYLEPVTTYIHSENEVHEAMHENP